MKNIHQGETGLIVATGPSQSDIPVEFLNSLPSIAVNHYYKRDGFQPWYLVITDYRQLETEERREVYAPWIENVNHAFINEHWSRYFPGCTPMRRNPHPKNKFSTDVSGYFGNWAHVVYAAAQVAFTLGFQTVLIAGMDMDYVTNGKHFYQDKEVPGFNNFPGQYDEWYDRANESMGVARKEYEKHGRRLLNISTRTKCTTLERVDWGQYGGNKSQGTPEGAD